MRVDKKHLASVSLALDMHDTANFFLCLAGRGIAIRTIRPSCGMMWWVDIHSKPREHISHANDRKLCYDICAQSEMVKQKADQKLEALAVTVSGKGEESVRCRGATLPKNRRGRSFRADAWHTAGGGAPRGICPDSDFATLNF